MGTACDSNKGSGWRGGGIGGGAAASLANMSTKTNLLPTTCTSSHAYVNPQQHLLGGC